jgi:hypothetical protein
VLSAQVRPKIHPRSVVAAIAAFVAGLVGVLVAVPVRADAAVRASTPVVRAVVDESSAKRLAQVTDRVRSTGRSFRSMRGSNADLQGVANGYWFSIG